MSNATVELSPARVARFTGGFYVAYIVVTVLATILGQIGMGDAPQVEQAIVTNEGSFRVALVLALVSGFLFLLVAWGLYVLLRPVNRNLALLFLLLNAVGVATQGASLMWLISALLQGDPASQMQAYSAAQVEGLAYLSIGVYKVGFVTAQLFLRDLALPARVPRLPVGVPPPMARRPTDPRRDRRHDLVHPGLAPPGVPRDPHPWARRELDC